MSDLDSKKLDKVMTDAGWSKAASNNGMMMYSLPVSTAGVDGATRSSSFQRAQTAMRAVIDGPLTTATRQR